MKVNVSIIACFDSEGKMTPLAVRWEDGRIFHIDCILDERRAASLKAGGIGMRYLCRIKGQERYLWYEEPRWFVEGK